MGESMWGRTSIGRTRAHFTQQSPMTGTGWGGTTAVTTSFSYTAPPPQPPPSYNLKTNTWGNTIPISAGERRLPGAYIWAKVSQNFQQQQELNPDGTERLSEETFLWNPFADIAVSFGYNGEPDAPTQLSRVYFDGVEVNLSSLNYTFYPGSETQEPDPTIRADKGAANTPAFRGQTYMVIRNVDLSKFGNRFPAVSAVINSLAEEGAFESVPPFPIAEMAGIMQTMDVDWSTRTAWLVSNGSENLERIFFLRYQIVGTELVFAGVEADFVVGLEEVTGQSNREMFLGAIYVKQHDRFITWAGQGASVYRSWTRAGQLTGSLGGFSGRTISWYTVNFQPTEGAPYVLIWDIYRTGSFNNSDYRMRCVKYDGESFTLMAETGAQLDGVHVSASQSVSDGISGPYPGAQSEGESEVWFTAVASTSPDVELVLCRAVFDGSSISIHTVSSPYSQGSEPRISRVYYDAARSEILVFGYDNGDYSFGTPPPENAHGNVRKFNRQGALLGSLNGLGYEFVSGSGVFYTAAEANEGNFHPSDRIGDKIVFAHALAEDAPPRFSVFDIPSFSVEQFEWDTFPGDSRIANEWTDIDEQIFAWEMTRQNTAGFGIEFLGTGYEPPDRQPFFDTVTSLHSIIPAVSQVGSTLSGSLVGRATTLAEIDESDITTINLDEPIRGWMVWENSEYKQHLANDGMVFGFDWFESGQGITLKRHVDGSNFTVDRVLVDGDLLLIEDSDAQIARVDEQEIAAIARVKYIDPTVDFRVSEQRARRARFPIPAVNSNRTAEYTTSVIMDARTALSNATKALFREDVGRVVLTFHLAPRRIDIETGDVVQLPPLAGKVWTVRIIETVFREDFVTECTAQVLLENEAIDLEGFSGEPFVYTNGPPRLMRSPFVRSQAKAYPSEIVEVSS